MRVAGGRSVGFLLRQGHHQTAAVCVHFQHDAFDGWDEAFLLAVRHTVDVVRPRSQDLHNAAQLLPSVGNDRDLENLMFVVLTLAEGSGILNGHCKQFAAEAFRGVSVFDPPELQDRGCSASSVPLQPQRVGTVP